MHIDLHILHAHEVVTRKKTTFCLAYVKRKKSMIKMQFFHETMRTHIEYEDIYMCVNIFLRFVTLLKSTF
jgi:hypothetical protein